MIATRRSHEWSVRPADPADRGTLTAFLSSAPRLHQHLDWVGPLELIGRHPFLIALQGKRPAGCLACPEDPTGVAWLRLFAVAGGLDPARAWDKLWPAARFSLEQQGVALAAALTLTSWLPPVLEASGFTRTNAVVFLEWEGTHAPPRPAHAGEIRPMRAQDLPQVEIVDHQAFGPLWQHSGGALAEALHQAGYATVLEVDGAPVAYQISTQSPPGAHLARLAVDPAWQGHGLGEALVSGLLEHFLRAGVRRVTVNTQGDNEKSHRLYRKLGFRETGQRFEVYELRLGRGK